MTEADGVLHNSHEVDELVKRCDKLLAAITQLGAQVDLGGVRAACEGFAAGRILILKGICTEAEYQGEMMLRMHAMLGDILLQVEQARLSQGAEQQQQQQGRGQKIAVVQPSRLIAQPGG